MMNLSKLAEQEQRFLFVYPGGFHDPLMERVAKRHNIAKFVKLVQESLSEEAFKKPNEVVEVVAKIIRSSSLVSVFEKNAFRNMLQELNDSDRVELAESYRHLIRGEQGLGFELLTSFLGRYDNAKWPVITSVLYYSNPTVEFLVKPTTAKNVIAFFEIEDLKYVTKPNYEFYCKYREAISQLKKNTGILLQVDNAAFCGFLMFAVGMYE